MNCKYKYILFLGLTFTACKRDLLSPTPQTSISDQSAFDSPVRVGNQVLSLYSSLKSGAFYGGRYIVYGDIRGEDFINETSNLVTASDVYNLNPQNSATSVKNLWAQAYLTINRCNLFLEGMTAKGNAIVGDSLAKVYTGEARLIRALSYYSLLQLYAQPYAKNNGNNPGLPLRLTGIIGAGNSDLARSSVADVYKQVLADLDYAETNLPLKNSSNYNNTTRAHRNTAIALKTRVYLTMNNYQKVIDEANKIVSATAPYTATTGVAHALQADITNVFKAPYTTPESILSMPMTTSASPLDYPGTQNSLCSYFYMAASSPGATEYSLNPAGIIGNANWSATDKRRSLIYTTSAGKQFLAKYTTANPYTDYPPVIRYSEVLLNLAEARARLNSAAPDAQALALLNAVRQRSDATKILVAASSGDLIELILTERRIEFLGEGMRSTDLLRLLQTIPLKGTAPSKGPGEDGYIWPISSDELSTNKLIGS